MSITEQHPEEKKMPTIEEASDLHLLDGAALQFRREGIRLQMRRGEEEWQEISLARLFPLTDGEKWIAVVDKENKEIGILKDLHGISREGLALLHEELYKRYLVPQISRILACRDRFDITEWTVATDRGELTFLMRHPHESIQLPLPGRVSLLDVEGNRYDVPDITALDPASRAWIEQRM